MKLIHFQINCNHEPMQSRLFITNSLLSKYLQSISLLTYNLIATCSNHLAAITTQVSTSTYAFTSLKLETSLIKLNNRKKLTITTNMIL